MNNENERKILLDAISSFSSEYKDIADTWKLIEIKAQYTATINGAFLAGLLAILLKKETNQIFLQDRYLLWIVVVALGAAFSTIVCVLWPRDASIAPYGSDLWKDLKKCMEEENEESEKRINNAYRDNIECWLDANSKLRRINKRKACLLRVAQISTFVVVVVGIVILTKITIS